MLCEKWLMLCTLIAKRNVVFFRHLCKGGIIPKSGAHVTQNSHFLSGPILLLCLWDAWEPQCSSRSIPRRSLFFLLSQKLSRPSWRNPPARLDHFDHCIHKNSSSAFASQLSSHLQQSYWCIVACCYLWLVGPRVTRHQFFIGPRSKFPTPLQNDSQFLGILLCLCQARFLLALKFPQLPDRSALRSVQINMLGMGAFSRFTGAACQTE